MSQHSNQQKMTESLSQANQKLAGIAVQVAGLTLLIVFIALFGGIWLDRVLGTKPVILILLVLGSAPLALVLTYYMVIRTMNQIQIEPSKNSGSQDEEEAETGE